MNANAIAAVSDILVAEFEALATRAERISALLESLRVARHDFESLLHDSIAEYDSLAAGAIEDAAGGVRDVNDAVAAHKHQLQEWSAQAVASGAELCGRVESEVTDGASAGNALASEAAGSAETAVSALTLAIDQVASAMAEAGSHVDSKWTDILSAVSTFHVNARRQAEAFQSTFREQGVQFEQGANEFAGELQSEVIEPVEQLAESFETSLSNFSLQLLNTGFDQVGKTLDDAVRDEIASVIDQAVEEIRTFVSEKARQLIERRDRSQPEREALDQVFETLKQLSGDLQDRVESVVDIKSAVGF